MGRGEFRWIGQKELEVPLRNPYSPTAGKKIDDGTKLRTDLNKSGK